MNASRGPAILPLIAAVSFSGIARADQTVQVPVAGLLNTRTVTTLTGGVLVPFTLGIDGGYGGYLTAAASQFHKDPAGTKGLPDDGVFPADARHPDVVLHFSNPAGAASPQTRSVPKGVGQFTVPVPVAVYSKMFLFFTSSEGGSALKLSFNYSDATVEVVNQTVPDYGAAASGNDPVFFNLASKMVRWDKQSNINDTPTHNIHGLEAHPAAGKILTSIKVEKTANGYLTFWGATGIAIGAVSGGGGAGAGGSGAGGAGAGGSGGRAGTGGNAGVGGGGGSGAGGMMPGSGGAGGSGSGGAAGTSAEAEGGSSAGGAAETGEGGEGGTGAGGESGDDVGDDGGSRRSGCSAGGGFADGSGWFLLFLLFAARSHRRGVSRGEERNS